jgi:hypothetical protein
MPNFSVRLFESHMHFVLLMAAKVVMAARAPSEEFPLHHGDESYPFSFLWFRHLAPIMARCIR